MEQSLKALVRNNDRHFSSPIENIRNHIVLYIIEFVMKYLFETKRYTANLQIPFSTAKKSGDEKGRFVSLLLFK